VLIAKDVEDEILVFSLVSNSLETSDLEAGIEAGRWVSGCGGGVGVMRLRQRNGKLWSSQEAIVVRGLLWRVCKGVRKMGEQFAL